MEIKTNHMVVITPKMNFLQMPIRDEFYVPPSHPKARERTTEFASEKGLLMPKQPTSPTALSNAGGITKDTRQAVAV
jgi:hypothetical protein